MNYGKAVEEVWSWRNILARELEQIPAEKRAEYLNQKARNICREYGLNLRAVRRGHAVFDL